MRKVPFFDYPFVFKSEEDAILEIIRDVGRRGAFIMQQDLEQFEQHLAEYTGAGYALGVGNATDAMEMFLSASGIGRGDEIIVCSHTMIATASAVKAVGATPVPVDAGSDHLMDPASAEAAVTPKTKGIMPTQLNGRTANMDDIFAVAERHGLTVFEDSAQALGSKFKGRCAGTFGVGGCISFYPAKILGSLGDGGAILCNDQGLYETMKAARDHGRQPDGNVSIWGRNSRLDNLQAAVLDYFLGKYSEVVDRRRELAAIYHGRLSGIEPLSLPPPPDNGDHFDVFQNYELQAENRDGLKSFLADQGIGTLIQWGGTPVHGFRKLGFDQDLPATDAMFQRLLMLPMNMSLSDDDVHYVCDAVEGFYG